VDCILVVAWSNLILWTLCGQKNSIQDGYMLTGDFAKYLCFGEFMQSEGEGVKSGAKVTDQAAV